MTMYPDQSYEPSNPLTRPGVVTWFKVYAAVMMLVYLLVFGLGLLMMLAPDQIVDPDALSSNRPTTQTEALIMGVIYAGLGAVFGIAYLLGLVFGRGKAVWIYDLVLICIGLTSCACMPFAIPLLVFWLKQECKDWFYQPARW